MKVKIEFSPESWKELEKLKEEIKVVSVEDVIRDALSYLRFSREQVKEGKKICTVTLTEPPEIRPMRFWYLDMCGERRRL